MKYKIEKEFKILIDQKTFNRIIENEDFQLIIQENYYYDTQLKDVFCRIRNIEDLYIFNLKKVINDKVIEYEYQVDDNNIQNPYILKLLQQLNINHIPKLIGSMLTCRYFKKLKNGELCIDLSKYLNHQDFEIEYELFDEKNDNLDEFKDFLNKYQIDFQENKISKFQRFMELLNG